MRIGADWQRENSCLCSPYRRGKFGVSYEIFGDVPIE